jgi:hypothetical protein
VSTWLEADREALDRWLELHVLARRLPADGDSRALADAALAHIMPFVAELPEEPPFVGVHNPTKPAKETLEPWIAAVEAAVGTPESGRLLANGVELGLLGVDAEVDRRAAAVIVDGFELPAIQAALEPITRQALLDPLVGTIAEQLAETVEQDPDRRSALRELCRNPAAYAALGELAQGHPSLAVMSVYLWATVDRDPRRRPTAARTLLMLDSSAGADVRALWGEHGPLAAEEHAALLSSYRDAEREPPEHDVKRALESLMSASLDDVDRGNPLALALRGLDGHLELPAYCAWYAAARRPGAGQRLDAWARIVARALGASPDDVPVERAGELTALAAAELIAPKTLDGYFEALSRLRRSAEGIDQALTQALSNALGEHADPTELLAMMFAIWAKAPDGGGAELHDTVLAPAARPYRDLNAEVRSHLGPRRQAEWDAFTQRHGKGRFGRVRARFARRGR